MTAAIAVQPTAPAALQRYARATGVAMLLSIIFGFLGEMILPDRLIVAGDAAATAANVTGHPILFRLTFASYLVEGIADITLCVFWYILLRPVNRNLALLSAFFGVVSMVTFAIAQASFFSASIILPDRAGMGAFDLEQRQALAMLAMRVSAMIAYLFICFYGMASMLRGFLIARSGYLPRLLGILLLIGGAGFFLRGITYIVAPQYSSVVLLLPMAIAGFPLTGWLLFKGVNLDALARRVA